MQGGQEAVTGGVLILKRVADIGERRNARLRTIINGNPCQDIVVKMENGLVWHRFELTHDIC